MYIAGMPLQNMTASTDHMPSLDVEDFLTKVSTVMINADPQLDNGKHIICSSSSLSVHGMHADQCSRRWQTAQRHPYECEILEEAGYTHPIHVRNMSVRRPLLELSPCTTVFSASRWS